MASPTITVEDLMARPYRKIVSGTPADGYVAEAPELERCIGLGETETEALDGLHQAMESWFEAAIAEGRTIPEPGDQNASFSGNLRLRMPRSLHAQAARIADREGVSLNTFLLTSIAVQVGAKK